MNPPIAGRILDGPYIYGVFEVTDKRASASLNPDVAQAHLVEGEAWWDLIGVATV